MSPADHHPHPPVRCHLYGRAHMFKPQHTRGVAWTLCELVGPALAHAELSPCTVTKATQSDRQTDRESAALSMPAFPGQQPLTHHLLGSVSHRFFLWHRGPISVISQGSNSFTRAPCKVFCVQGCIRRLITPRFILTPLR